MGDDDAWTGTKRVIAYVVTTVWVVTFIATLLRPDGDHTALLAVQALMMMVAGALYVDRRSSR